MYILLQPVLSLSVMIDEKYSGCLPCMQNNRLQSLYQNALLSAPLIQTICKQYARLTYTVTGADPGFSRGRGAVEKRALSQTFPFRPLNYALFSLSLPYPCLQVILRLRACPHWADFTNDENVASCFTRPSETRVLLGQKDYTKIIFGKMGILPISQAFTQYQLYSF